MSLLLLLPLLLLPLLLLLLSSSFLPPLPVTPLMKPVHLVSLMAAGFNPPSMSEAVAAVDGPHVGVGCGLGFFLEDLVDDFEVRVEGYVSLLIA